MAGDPCKLTTQRCQSTLAGLRLTLLLALLAPIGCKRLNESLTKGLEEEKSYTRHAMEYHRGHPDERRGDNVLDTWSTADYIALSVAKQKLVGEWARPSDQLSFLPASLRLDSGARPFCVIQMGEDIIVLRFLNKTTGECTIDIIGSLDTSKIHSGDMEFSGRADYWTYIFRQTAAP